MYVSRGECTGSLALGAGCGECSRCMYEAPKLVASYQNPFGHGRKLSSPIEERDSAVIRTEDGVLVVSRGEFALTAFHALKEF